jgi:predicted metal-dependent phosphoesterase TrpH
MTFKVDLHIHTKYSGDTYSEPEENVLHAIKSGLCGMAFTEHYSYEASEHAESLREKYKGRIMIFRGVEFSAQEGHCLVFGVNTDSLSIKNAPVEELIKIVCEHGGVIIPSHPFRGNNSLDNMIRHIQGISAIEGCNGYSHHSQNVKAIDVAKSRKIPYTGGSDSHEPGEVGACYTEFFDKVTQDNFLSLLKAGNYIGHDTRKVSRVWPF